jgi:hypothetical protein
MEKFYYWYWGSFIVFWSVFIYYAYPKPTYKEQYTEIFECYDKKFGYYDVQDVVCDLYWSRDIDYNTAMLLHAQIDSLHKIEANKIDSLNKIIDGK